MAIVFLGWLGTFIYLLNHAYISLANCWNKKLYYGANALAASFLIISSVFNTSWQAVVINAFWLVISLALLANKNVASLSFNLRIFYSVLMIGLAVFFGNILLFNQINFALLGWLSAFTFSACYLLFCQEKLLPRYYLLWNAFAAIALMPQLWLDHNWPVFYLEISWALISLYGAGRKFSQPHLID